MKLLTLILLATAGGIHWLRSNPNRSAKGQFMRDQPIERWGVYVVLAVVALLVLAGCAKPPSRTVTGGSASTLNESAQTAVPPSYPPAYPQEQVAVTAPAAHPAPTTQPSDNAFLLPPGWTFTRTTYFPPIPVSDPTVLNRTTNSTSTTQPSSSTDIVVPKSWGGYWIAICLSIAAGCAIWATLTPAKRLYLVAITAAALAALALVPPAYLGAALLITVVALLAGVAWFAYRSGVWKVDAKQAETDLAKTSVALNQVVAGVEKVKATIGADEEINTLLAIEQDRSTKDLIRKARGK